MKLEVTLAIAVPVIVLSTALFIKIKDKLS